MRAKTFLLVVLTCLLGFLVPLRAALAVVVTPKIIQPLNPDDPPRLARERSVLVIGGGLGGLSAALELAERGYRVTIREADSVLGGRLATRNLQTGVGTFRVEHGLHMWFENYHMFKNIRDRLDLNGNFRDYDKIHFFYRDYQPETIFIDPPVYPANLVGILLRSPNLNLLNAMREIRVASDMVFYNHHNNNSRFDGMTFRQWAESRNVNKAFFDVLLYPAATVTLNDPERISAAEMLLYMHYYFTSQPRAIEREVTTVDHGTAVIDPWANHLRNLGVNISLNHWVKGLRFENGRAVGELGHPERYDWVVLAAGVKGTQAVVRNSTVADMRSDQAVHSLRERLGTMKVAPHYKVLRVWFDKPTAPNRPDVLETPQHKPITLAALFHQMEREPAVWAQQTGGSVVEFHLYNTPEFRNLTQEQVWERIRPTALELLPELNEARAVGMTMGSYDDFTSFEVGQASLRPRVVSPRDDGVENLVLAGDWLHTEYPTALMERAVATGREAANAILLKDRVRQVPLIVTTSHGPGLIPNLPPQN